MANKAKKSKLENSSSEIQVKNHPLKVIYDKISGGEKPTKNDIKIFGSVMKIN